MHQKVKKGFTIIELMLAMSVVAMLMLAIAVMVMQMITLVTKGNTMRELNTAGRTINDDLTRTFNSSSMIRSVDNTNLIREGDSGVFCTGTYSYVWNGARILEDTNSRKVVPFRYAGRRESDDGIRFARVRDIDGRFCQSDEQVRRQLWALIPANDGSTKELLSPGETGLQIHQMEFNVISFNENSNQSLVNIRYVLGTKNDKGQIVSPTSSGNGEFQCRPGAELKEYCAINRFDLTVRTLGR